VGVFVFGILLVGLLSSIWKKVFSAAEKAVVAINMFFEGWRLKSLADNPAHNPGGVPPFQSNKT